MTLMRALPYVPRIVLRIAFLVILAACKPVEVSGPTVEPLVVSEAATPTPEVFNPIDPVPTQSESTLPLTCQVIDLNVYVDEIRGFCFAYPLNFSLDEGLAGEGTVNLFGPALDGSAEPLRASLEISLQPVPAGSALTPLVDAFLSSLGEIPWEVTRETTTLGGEPAEKLEPVPGLLSSRVVMALHGKVLFTLRFHPSDMAIAQPDVEALAQTVNGSFTFLPLFGDDNY